MNQKQKSRRRLSLRVFNDICNEVSKAGLGFRISPKSVGTRIVDDRSGLAIGFYNGDLPHECVAVVARMDGRGSGLRTVIDEFEGKPLDVLEWSVSLVVKRRIREQASRNNVLLAFGIDCRGGVVA
jgi:hypothetical protein